MKSIGRGFFDALPGGLADKKSLRNFDKRQVAAGAKVEMEHTNDPNVAREIARDHLTEFPNYYRKLKKFERGLKTAAVDYETLYGSRHDDVPEGVDRQRSFEFSAIAQRNLDAEARGGYLQPGSNKRRHKPSSPDKDEPVLDTADSGNPTWDSSTDVDGGVGATEPTG